MLSMRARQSEIDIFNKNTIKTTTCWNWVGYIQNAGYGSMVTYKGNYLAHRWAFENFVRPIKPKMTIDHLCKNKICVNPKHMEEVTRAENIRRCGLQGVALKESQKTHCNNGHDYSVYGVKYKNGFNEYGTRKYARRCTKCHPKFARYVCKY